MSEQSHPAYLSLDQHTRVGKPLSAAVKTLAEGGLSAQPVMLGHAGKIQGVVISIEQFHALRDHFEDLLDLPELRRRLAGHMEPTALEELADEFGVDLTDSDRAAGQEG